MNNVFKKSLLNLNDLDNDGLDDFLEEDNNDNSKIYHRESPRYSISNTTSIEDIKAKTNHTINFSEIHKAILNDSEISNHPTMSSIFTNNKDSNHNPNDVKNSLSIHHLEEKEVRDFNKTDINLIRQFNVDDKLNASHYNNNNSTHQMETIIGKGIHNSINLKEEVHAVKYNNNNPIIGNNTQKKDKNKNETVTHNTITEHENLNNIMSHPLKIENKLKNEILAKIPSNTISVKLPVSPKKPESESNFEFENEESKQTKWDILNQHDEKEHDQKNSLIITNKNTVEKSNNKQIKQATPTEEIKTKKNGLEIKNILDTNSNQQENHKKLSKENITNISSNVLTFNSTNSFQNQIQNNHSVSVITKQDNIINKPISNSITESNNKSKTLIHEVPITQPIHDNQKNIETKPTLIDKKEPGCAKLIQAIKNETELTNNVFEDKLSNLKKSIKDSFNNLLLQNQENLEENKKQNFDMLNNLDTLIKSLVKNVTHSHKEQMNYLHSETISQLKELKEAVKVNNIEETKLIHKIINNTVGNQKEDQNAKKNNLKQAKIFIKNESIKADDTSFNDTIKNINQKVKDEKKIIIINNNQESSNLRNKPKNVEMQKPVTEKQKELNEDENFTKKFLANVISKLISHPLHIDTDEGDTQKHSRKTISGIDKPNIMIISNSSGTKIENKNINNYNSHNTRLYSK